MRFDTLALPLFLVAQVLSSPAPRSLNLPHEYRPLPPPKWTPLRRAAPSFKLPLRIGLAQSNLDQLESFLLDVSHPDSPNYSKHWSPAQVSEIFRPSNTSIEIVHQWLTEQGIHHSRVRLSTSGGWIAAEVTVQEAEHLLDTKYYEYEHADSGSRHIACEKAYHLPGHISKHVDLITPTLHFDVQIRRALNQSTVASWSRHPTTDGINIGDPGASVVSPKTSGGRMKFALGSSASQCDQFMTPDCLRELYDFSISPPLSSQPRSSLGIVEYTPQAYVPGDMDMFFQVYAPEQVGRRPEFISVDGGVNQNQSYGFNVNGESNLDLQYAMALVGPQQEVSLYQVGDMQMGASFNNFLDALDDSYCTSQGGDDSTVDAIYTGSNDIQGNECGTVRSTDVISTSYGYNEADLTPAYSSRQCAEYGKLGLLGVTILYSSGDSGVAGNGNSCLVGGTTPEGGKTFNPSFPGTCPFVTSVGATQIKPGSKVANEESACMQTIYSGGGFSNRFALPDYQRDAVEGYLAKYPPPYGPDQYNATGSSRAYPDISANGAHYMVAVNGQFTQVFGTSASSPVVAAFLTEINNQRKYIGKGPIGFINPAIYSQNFTNAFNDITSGSNPGCGTQGFSATAGWDPVTGLGTPHYPSLKDLWLSLP